MYRKSSTGITEIKIEIEIEKIDFRDRVSTFSVYICRPFESGGSCIVILCLFPLQHMENIPVHGARDFDGHTNPILCKDTDEEMMVII